MFARHKSGKFSPTGQGRNHTPKGVRHKSGKFSPTGQGRNHTPKGVQNQLENNPHQRGVKRSSIQDPGIPFFCNYVGFSHQLLVPIFRVFIPTLK